MKDKDARLGVRALDTRVDKLADNLSRLDVRFEMYLPMIGLRLTKLERRLTKLESRRKDR